MADGKAPLPRPLHAGVFPERTPRSYPHSVDAYVRYLDQRLHQGCHNVSQIWRELRQQGYRGQLSSVWNWLHQHRGHTKRAPIFPATKLSIRTSPQHTTWLILKEPPSAKAYLEELCRASPQIATLAHLGREFFRRVRSRDLAAWPQWLECARHTPAWLRIQPPARSAYRRSGTDSALEPRPGRKACAQAQADQTACTDVPASICYGSVFSIRPDQPVLRTRRKSTPPLHQMCARTHSL
jgi:hypothetical protein